MSDSTEVFKSSITSFENTIINTKAYLDNEIDIRLSNSDEILVEIESLYQSQLDSVKIPLLKIQNDMNSLVITHQNERQTACDLANGNIGDSELSQSTSGVLSQVSLCCSSIIE